MSHQKPRLSLNYNIAPTNERNQGDTGVSSKAIQLFLV